MNHQFDPFKKIMVLTAVLISSPLVKAESLECKGSVPPENKIQFQISLDIEKPGPNNVIQYFLPDASTLIQGLGINKRKYQASQVVYFDSFDPSVSIVIKMSDNKILDAVFNHAKAGYEKLPLHCELTGHVPAQVPCPEDKNASLIDAVRTSNDSEIVARAIECGANVNFANEQLCTPLMFALDANCGISGAIGHGPGSGVFSKTKDILDLLISSGAYVNVADKDKETPLIKAVKNNIEDVYQSFIASEVEIDAKDANGFTALMYSAIVGNPRIVSDLLLGNPDRRMQNNAGMTAFDLAKYWGHDHVLELLKVPDLRINIAGNEDGSCTPLSIKIAVDQTVELRLKPTQQMFRFELKKLGIDFMAAPGEIGHQIFVVHTKGDYDFACGIHGGVKTSKGVLHVE